MLIRQPSATGCDIVVEKKEFDFFCGIAGVAGARKTVSDYEVGSRLRRAAI